MCVSRSNYTSKAKRSNEKARGDEQTGYKPNIMVLPKSAGA